MKTFVEMDPNSNLWKYPRLMISKKNQELIVLFIDMVMGISLSNTGKYKFGNISKFDLEYFQIFEGSITLKNEDYIK